MKTDLSIAVNVRLCVDKKTAEACLRLVEIYINSNSQHIAINRLENGEMELHYEPV